MVYFIAFTIFAVIAIAVLYAWGAHMYYTNKMSIAAILAVCMIESCLITGLVFYVFIQIFFV